MWVESKRWTDWAAPLFFANAEAFQQRVLQAVDAALTPVRWLVVTAEPVTIIDVTAADMLAEFDRLLTCPDRDST